LASSSKFWILIYNPKLTFGFFIQCNFLNFYTQGIFLGAFWLLKALKKKLLLSAYITFFKRRPTDPSQQCKRTSNNIQDPLPRWILTIFKLKFGGGNLFSLVMTSTIEGNNSMGSLLKPLLKKVSSRCPKSCDPSLQLIFQFVLCKIK
jgi:hypothetical protein